MNIPRSSSEQDDIVNSLNYEGIAVMSVVLLTFLDSDRLRVGSALHRLNSLNDCSYGDRLNHQGITLHIIIVLLPTLLNLPECFRRDTLCSIHAITTSR